MENKDFDLGIIGCGPAGYTAAFAANDKGLSVVIFEKEFVGGTCLNKGCIPTKAIIHSAEVFEDMKNAQDLGLNAEKIGFDWAKVIERKDNIVFKLRKGLELAFKNKKIEIVNSNAEVVSDELIKDENGNIFNCKKIIVATGAEPREIKGLEFDHKQILSSDDILNLKGLPKSIVIVGSGAIGIEWARIFKAFEVEVTVIEMAPHLLPLADIDVSKRLERSFKTKGIKFYLNNSVEKIEKDENKVCLTLKTGENIEAEKVLVAVGRKILDITNKNSAITILGDSFGSIQLAHFAIKQALEDINGIKFDKSLIPSVVYGNPEIAWVGKREQDLEIGSFKKSNFLISALGKAQCDDSTDGLIKILTQHDKIVGAHIMSKEASSLIQQIVIAIQNNISVEKLKEVCFAHPTYSEGIFESLFKLY